MRLGAIVVAVLPVPAAWSEDQPKDKPLTPAEAANQVGEKVTVELEVKPAGKGSGVAFLNSEAAFKDEKNFTLFINRAGVEQFKPVVTKAAEGLTLRGAIVRGDDRRQPPGSANPVRRPI
jgi:hypothetical protein